jgi:hypothetical protein
VVIGVEGPKRGEQRRVLILVGWVVQYFDTCVQFHAVGRSWAKGEGQTPELCCDKGRESIKGYTEIVYRSGTAGYLWK